MTSSTSSNAIHVLTPLSSVVKNQKLLDTTRSNHFGVVTEQRNSSFQVISVRRFMTAQQAYQWNVDIQQKDEACGCLGRFTFVQCGSFDHTVEIACK